MQLGLTRVPGSPDRTPPTLSSGTIAADGQTLTLVFSEPVRWQNGDVTVDDYTCPYGSGSGTDTLVFTLGRLVYQGESLTVVITGAAVRDLSGIGFVNNGQIPITNNSTQTP